MPTHHSIRTRPDRLVFRTHDEAAVLWRSLTGGLPELLALCLMPDHIHLMHPEDVTGRLGALLGGFAEWRNRTSGARGPLWRHRETPTPVHGPAKARTVERYIHLNPCRARLTQCPLAWPWSTHRDRTGLADPSVRRKARDPEGFHAYVSGDPSTQVGGTPWPIASPTLTGEWADLLSIQAAVSAITRRTADELQHRSPARTLLVRALGGLSQAPRSRVADFVGVSTRTLQRVPTTWGSDLARVARVLDDPRFPLLHGEDLRRLHTWTRYRNRR